MLSAIEIEESASRRGARKEDLEYFQDIYRQPDNEEGALLNLYHSAQLYGWEILTIKAIEAGIKYAYAEVVANSKAFYEGYQRLFQARFTRFGLKLIYRLKPDMSH